MELKNLWSTINISLGIKNKMSQRADNCKCGEIIVWDTDDNEVICDYCETEYIVGCDDILVHWIEEKYGDHPHKTYPR